MSVLLSESLLKILNLTFQTLFQISIIHHSLEKFLSSSFFIFAKFWNMQKAIVHDRFG